MMKKILLLALALGLGAACPASEAGDKYTVTIESGTIRGWDDGGTIAFTNIPYSRFERFMPPQKPEPWDGVLECTSFPHKAMQHSGLDPDPIGLSEDGATRLNVWTSGTEGRKPVMVWLHGGGFATGAGYANPNDSGRGIARQDIVLVSVNHRLDVLGFLDLSACGEKYRLSGNVGMLDIVLALEWVRNNIEAFGGDPDNVTIFGESGGGGKVGTLMCMPAARGLFHKAIIQSGTILNGNTSEITRAIGLATLEELGLTPADAGRLADIPYEELYRAGHAAVAKIAGDRKPGSPGFRGFGPTVDGEVLVCQPFQPSFAEFSRDIPLIMGTTFNELQRSWYAEKPTPEEAAGILRRSYGDSTDDYIRAFRKAYPEFDTPADMLSVDSMFRPSTIFTADTRAGEGGAPVFMYMFAWKSPVRGGVMGAAHAYELPFVFHTTEVSARYLGEETDEIRHLADVMSAAWTAFARSGDPSTAYLDWKPYTAEEGACAYFGHSCELRYNYDRELITIMQEN